MSGGSFNYLCFKSLGKAMESSDLHNAIDVLKSGSYSQAVGGELSAILEAYNRLDMRFRRMEHVLKCLEWWKSSDWSEENLIEACKAWDVQNGVKKE